LDFGFQKVEESVVRKYDFSINSIPSEKFREEKKLIQGRFTRDE
jgi:hypothetical protein